MVSTDRFEDDMIRLTTKFCRPESQVLSISVLDTVRYTLAEDGDSVTDRNGPDGDVLSESNCQSHARYSREK